MKVLEVLDCFYPNLDGPIEVAVGLARTFKEKGFGEMELLVPDYPERVGVEGVNIHRCRSVRSNGNYRAAVPAFDGRVKKLIKKGGFDVIHLHSPFTLGRYALKIARNIRCPSFLLCTRSFGTSSKSGLKASL